MLTTSRNSHQSREATAHYNNMMISRHGNIFRITGPLVRGTNLSRMDFPDKGNVFFDIILNKQSSKNRVAGDLKLYWSYDITIMLPRIQWDLVIRIMVTSSHGNHRSPMDFPHKGQWCGALMFYLICPPTNSWANSRNAGNLRRHRSHYDVSIMQPSSPFYYHGLTLIPAWRSNYMPGKMWDEITYSFLKVKEWIINFIPHFIMDVITYPCWD